MNEVSLGFIDTTLADASIAGVEVKTAIQKRKIELAIAPEAIARAVAFAIELPDEVEIGSIVDRSTGKTGTPVDSSSEGRLRALL